MNHRFVTLALVLAAATASAQETTGAVRGRVLGPQGLPIADVRVVATSPAMLGERRARTAGDGVFTLLALPPGSYELHITAVGYQPVVVLDVGVQLGRVSGLEDLPMRRTTVTLDEVRVRAQPLTLDPVRTTIGATLDSPDLAALPAERDHKALISILPHLNVSYNGDPVNSAGSTGLENMYFVDGVNTTNTLSGSSALTLPQNFVKTVDVRIGGYDAEFGRALGAIVNAVTYTGGNTFEATTFGYFTHHALSGKPRLAPMLGESGAYSYDLGVRVGGPILRDRLWYSAAYNPRLGSAERHLAGLGTYPTRSFANVFAAKLTWKATERTNVELAAFGDEASDDQVTAWEFYTGVTPRRADPYLRRFETGGNTISARAVYEAGPGILVQASVARSSMRNNDVARTTFGAQTGTFVDFVNDAVDGGVPWLDRNNEQRTSATAKASLAKGRHTAAIGAEYEANSNRNSFENPGIGFVWHNAEGFNRVRQLSRAVVHNRTPTVFLQDAWRMNDRLTLSAGVRRSSQYLIGTDGKVAQAFANEWQPRTGFSLRLTDNGSERFFGSYGRYYQQEPLSLTGFWYANYCAAVQQSMTDPRSPGAESLAAPGCDPPGGYPRVAGLQVENFHEATVGYERLVGSTNRLIVRVMRRELLSSFQQGTDSAGNSHLGSAGSGPLSFLPKPRREYTALELSLDGAWRGITYRASYVLSRNWGNYTGVASTDPGGGGPGNNQGLAVPEHVKNTTGLLPNDRTHVIKLSASQNISRRVTAGLLMDIASGTPLNELGATRFGWITFLAPRGSTGRTPTVWDLGVRLVYDQARGSGSVRYVLDVLHAGNPRTTVLMDMRHFRSVTDGIQGDPNANYRQPTAFQPPMMARFGIEFTR